MSLLKSQLNALYFPLRLPLNDNILITLFPAKLKKKWVD